MDFLNQTSDLLLLIVRALVDKPHTVTVITRHDLRPITFEVRVAREDLGKVVGKQGRTARSIRTILTASAQQREHASVNLDLGALSVQ